MRQKTKIIIAGIGGVGGYFGGLLAKKYAGNTAVEIIFVARGAHLKQIRENGLKVIDGEETFTVIPALATDDPVSIGIADFILVCTKNYNLVETIEQLMPCINNQTIVLPLLNGVDATAKISALLSGNTTVLQGCVYLVSQLKEPGVIENSGSIQTLYFGTDQEVEDTTSEKLFFLERTLQESGIQACFHPEILSVVWEKYIFVSAIATATAYFDACIGEVLEKHYEKIVQLIDEVKQVATDKGIAIDTEIASKTISKLKALPYEATSSMHRDFQNDKPNTEIESLTGYVVKAGMASGVSVAKYAEMYAALLGKS